MNCSLCGVPGTHFIKTVHERLGLIYLCEECAAHERGALRSVGSSCTCTPPQN